MIDKPILNVLNFLQQHGQAYIVGGYLRDTILGIKPKDVDLATDIPFDVLKKLIPSIYATEQGEKLGIGRFQRYGISFEISSFSSTIEKEMRQKDFTINALYHDGLSLFNEEYAKMDLESRFIRPHDDFLRHCETHPQAYIRAIRIASKIKGELDTGLLFLMKENQELFEKNQENRIRQEGYEILHSPHPQIALNLLHSLGFLTKKTTLSNETLQFDLPDISYTLAFLSLHCDTDTIEQFVRLFRLKEQHLTDMYDILRTDDSTIPSNDPKKLQKIIKWNRYRYQLEPEKLKLFFEKIKNQIKGT